MNDNLGKYLQKKWDVESFSISPVSGGDINTAFKIQTEKGNLFLKCNIAERYPRMFEREAEGLSLIRSSQTFRVPQVIEYGEFEHHSFLALEWIDTIHDNGISYWKSFGKTLAQMHQNSRPNFGLAYTNYIGTCYQYNNNHDTASDFLIFERFEPQISLALQNQKLHSNYKKGFERLYKKLDTIIPNELPALIHGDLWSGNWMLDSSKQVVLIDPSVSFGIREMDLAMMTLFGSIPSVFFESYHHYFPLEKEWENRLEIYQMYYLLVHINLFGERYIPPLKQILKKYI